MNEAKANTLAELLGGVVDAGADGKDVVRLDLQNPRRVVLIDEFGGHVFPSTGDFVGFRMGTGCSVLDSADWPSWRLSPDWSAPLARMIGGESHQSGGHVYVVLYERPDGAFVLIGEDGAGLYRDRAHYDGEYNDGEAEPDWVDFGTPDVRTDASTAVASAEAALTPYERSTVCHAVRFWRNARSVAGLMTPGDIAYVDGILAKLS